MSFEPPAGILDIGNATLRVGKLEVAETSGLNQGLLNIVKNDLLITETTEYTTNQTWGIKLPTTWVGEFEVKGASSKYVEFNFYNEGSTSNALGYTLNFKDTSLTLKYDNGNTLASATIPTIVGTYRKVNIFFERGVIAVSIDGARVLYFKESDTYNSVHGHPGMASRVASTTGGAFVNAFFESDHGGNSGFKNLRIVNGRFISDKTSNVSFIGSLGVGVHSPKESLDIRGNMHFNRVSNVSSVSVDSNVVTEYTGPHDRPLRKYPEVALTQNDESATSGYVASASSPESISSFQAWKTFSAFTSNQNRWQTSPDTYDSSGNWVSGVGATGVQFTDTNGGEHSGEWIKLQLPKSIKLDYIRYLCNYTDFMTKDFVILGSNDDTSWTLLKSVTGGTSIEDVYHTLHINADGYYKYYVWLTTAINGTGGEVLFNDICFYGYEEGSGSLDTTLKTVYNVPATTGTQLEVYYDAKDLTTMPSTVTDLSPNTNGGSVTGATLDTTDGIESFKFIASSSQNITSTIDTSYWGTNKLHSVAFWFKADRIDGKYNIFHIGNPSNNESSGFWISDGRADNNAGNSLNWWFYGGDSSTKVSTFSWTLNTWYHIALTFDGSTKKMYVNGHHIDFSVGNVITTLPTGIPNSASLAVGSTTNSVDYFDGSIANFRVYGAKTLNADQVKELYDYQKDYFLGSKSQVTLYKGHLGVGVTEPSVQLELAGDERIQEYPPGPMDDYETLIPGHGVFCVNVSGVHQASTQYAGWKAFNDNADGGSEAWITLDPSYGNGAQTLNKRLSSNTPLGEYIVLEFPYKVKISLAKLHERGGDTDNAPSAGIFYGSNDGVSWTELKSFSGLTYDNAADVYSDVEINATEYFDKIALVVTNIDDTSSTWMGIGELRYFGTPGPTTLDKGSLTLGRSLDVPRVSRYDVDTETPRPEKLVLDLDTTVNSSPTDISGKGNHPKKVGGVTHSEPDKAFNLDGSTGYLLLDDLPQADGNFIHSVSYWLQDLRPSGATSESFLYFGAAASANQDFQIQYNYNGNGTIYLGTQGNWLTLGNFGDLGGTGKKILRGEWNHYAYTYNGTNTQPANLKFYMNGEEMPMSGSGSSSALSFSTGSTPFYIGRHSSSVYPNNFEGKFSNFKMYNVALEPSEVKKLYNLGRTGRSMVISDTAVGIGKAPEAQLDVRGSARFAGAMTVQGQTRLTNFVAMGSGTNSTTRLFVDDPITVKIWNAFNNDTPAGEYTFEARATTLVHFHYSSGEDVNISESYLVTCADNGSPSIVQLKNAGYLYYSVGHGSRVVRFYASALPSSYNSSHFFLRISAIWKIS